MIIRLAVLVSLFSVLSPSLARAQTGSVLVARIGTKCLTALNGKVVCAACTGAGDQIVTPNFSVGGLQVGTLCLRRAGEEVTLALCKSGDVNEIFELNAITQEISNSDGKKLCVDLRESDWRPNEPAGLHSCAGTLNQKWLTAMLKSTPGKGKLRTTDTLGEVQSGDSISVNGKYLVIQ